MTEPSTNPLMTGKPGRPARLSPDELVAHGNANLVETGRSDIEWRRAVTGEVRLHWKREPEPQPSIHRGRY